MAVTTKTGLWKLAATKLGMAPAQHVLNADSPSTALELTFDQLYDQIRVAQFKEGKFDFLRRTELLRPAPTVDCYGETHEWTRAWDHVYSPPTDMLSFLRFTEDLPEAGIYSDYQALQLPIQYTELTLTEVAGTIIGATADNYLPPLRWPGGMFGYFVDDNGKVIEVEDDYQVVSTGVTMGLFGVVSRAALPIGFIDNEYIPGGSWSVNYSTIIAAGACSLALAVPLHIKVAYGDPREFDEQSITHRDHIATNLFPASAVYLADVTNPANWPVEVQNSIAADLAYQASLTHAKAPRMIQALERESYARFSKAVSSLSSDDGHVVGGGPSRATRSRW